MSETSAFMNPGNSSSLNSTTEYISFAAAVFAAATALAAYIGYLSMFTGFTIYDDEGAMLISLRSFITGHALYDQIVDRIRHTLRGVV